jgi:DNA-binding MarR family transcriptional regulator
MKSFTMNAEHMKGPDIRDPRFTREFARDEHGRLYSPDMRDLMATLNVDTTTIEALGALRIAGKFLHLLQDRWAERHGLTEGRLAVMFRLYRCGATPLGDLASALNMSPRNITSLVDHLEKDGLVERIPDPQDRRSVHASLTASGKERIEGLWKQGFERQSELVEGFTKDELAQLRHLCLQLVENARRELGK